MKLNIENFAKIKNANINFNGITVIAGENNTGKSTVGKIMFSLFNSFNCMDEKIKKQINFSLINQLLRTTDIEFERLDVLESISKELIKADLSDGKHSIENILKNYSRIVKIVDKKGIDEIWNILNYDEDRLKSLIIRGIFDREFHQQYYSLVSKIESFKLLLVVKNTTLEVSSLNNQITSKKSFDLTKKCIVIDDPFVLDKLPLRKRNKEFLEQLMDQTREYSHSSYLVKLLEEGREKSDISLITQDILSSRIEKFLNLIKEQVHGDFIVRDNKLMFHNEKNDFDIRLSNLSTGVKSFAILLKLLEDGQIEDNSMIVLDEPEVHLHPKWQLVYAELLVLLQKEFDLNILITTHSPYFLNAIEVYSKLYKIESRCDYYHSFLDEEGYATFKHVNGNVEDIYKLLAEPFDILQDLEEKIDDED